MNKNTYIYDTTKGFSPFIKYFYSNSMNIVVCKKRTKLCYKTIYNCDICFFVVDDITDIAILKEIYFKIDYFFIGCTNNFLSKQILNLNLKKTTILDFNNHSKYQLLEIINSDLMHN